MRSCRRARRWMRLAQDGELGLEERFALDDHLALCASCRVEFSVIERLEEALEVLPQPLLERVDIDRALLRIGNEIDARSHRNRADRHAEEGSANASAEGFRQTSATKPRRRTLVAAAALVLVVSGIFLWRASATSSEPTPESWVVAESSLVPIAFETTDHDTVFAAVGDALLRAFRKGGERSQSVASFELEMRPATRAGWPVLRFVERLLDDRRSVPQPSVALAAVRYLGERGDVHSATSLERALDDAELRPEVLLALGCLGHQALPVLYRAVEDSAHSVGALRVLVDIGGEEVADRLAELLRRKQRGDSLTLSRPVLLDALSQTGPAAILHLVRLADACQETRAEVLSRLRLVQGGSEELAQLLEKGRIHASEAAYDALAILQPPQALQWLEDRCEETRQRERALACLSRWWGPAPCASILRLHVDGRVDQDRLTLALRALAERDAESLDEFTESLVAREAAHEAAVWLELLFATDHAGAATSLALLALSTLLHPDERQWAALGVGEIGATTGAQALLAGFRDIDVKERRLRAATLISIHALLGEAGVQKAVNVSSLRGVGGLLSSLDAVDRRDRTAYGVHRVARALDTLDASRPMRETLSSLLLP